MIKFYMYRSNSNDSATEFDMGDMEFSLLENKKISSRENSRFSNMIYVSISDLIDGLLGLKDGAKYYEFVASDSSFILQFEISKSGVSILSSKQKYGPVDINDLLKSIDSGLDDFLINPQNKLPAESSVCKDLNKSREALKKALT